MTIIPNETKPSQKPRVRQPQATIDILRERIRTGRYIVGQKLPTQRELTEDLHVHRRIVRAALNQLEKEGLLRLRRNSPPIIQSAPPKNYNKAELALPTSNLVALVIDHGGPEEREGSAEQRIHWGLSQALGRAGYHVVFLNMATSEPAHGPDVDAMNLEYVLDHGFGGVVFFSYSGDGNRDIIREVSRQMPLVLIDRLPRGVDVDYVGMQNFQAMYDAAKHLIARGHRRIAFAKTSDDVSSIEAREQGYLQALRDHQGEILEEFVITNQKYWKIWPLFDAVFSLPAAKRPTAIICVNDFEAVRVTERLAFHKLTVPDDISIIGCDNVVEKLPGGVGLTSLAQPFVEIGKEAARLFLRRINNPDSLPLLVEAPVQLIERESTKSILY